MTLISLLPAVTIRTVAITFTSWDASDTPEQNLIATAYLSVDCTNLDGVTILAGQPIRSAPTDSLGHGTLPLERTDQLTPVTGSGEPYYRITLGSAIYYKKVHAAGTLVGLPTALPTTTNGGISADQTALAADSAVLTGSFTNPPATLQDELRKFLQQAFRDTGAWSGATAYVPNDVVLVSGTYYLCILAHTNHTPPNSTYWNAIGGGGGSSALNVATITTNTPLTSANDIVFINAAGGGIVVTLATAVGWTKPLWLARIDSSGNTVTINPFGTQHINGGPSLALVPFQGVQLGSNNADYTVLAGYLTPHQASHQAGGADAITGNLNATARINVLKSATLQGTRRGLNLIPGANVTITAADNAGTESVDVTIAAAGGGGGSPVTTQGDTIVGNASGIAVRLPHGNAGQQFGPVGADVAWITPSGAGGFVDPTTTDGDTFYRKKQTITSLSVGFIGDSITLGNGGGGVSPTAPDKCATDLSSASVTITAVNQGVSGSVSADWLPSGTNDTAAVTALASCPIVHIMLGTNDAHTSVSGATYRSNMRQIINAWVGRGKTVLVSYPIYGTGAGINTALLQAYQLAIDSLVNGFGSRQGDTSGYIEFANNAATLLQVDNVHPNQTGSDILAQLWANALLRTVNAYTEETVYVRLAKGSDSTVLTIDPSTHLPVWAASSAGFSDPTTTEGDLIYHHSSATTRLPIGTTNQALRVIGGTAAWSNVHYEAVAFGGAVLFFNGDIVHAPVNSV